MQNTRKKIGNLGQIHHPLPAISIIDYYGKKMEEPRNIIA
jgi:hypothetical protein